MRRGASIWRTILACRNPLLWRGKLRYEIHSKEGEQYVHRINANTPTCYILDTNEVSEWIFSATQTHVYNGIMKKITMRRNQFGKAGVLGMAAVIIGLTCCLGGCREQPVQTAATPIPATATPNQGGSPLGISSSYHEPATNIRFNHIGAEVGLSQSVVNCIVQDRRGFMWFGTEDGLNRYDGYDFVIYRPEPDNPASISDRWITVLFEDSKGNLWIGTRQGGLNRYDPTSDTFVRYTNNPDQPDTLYSNYVLSLYEDNRGFLWVGTTDGLDRYSSATDSFKHYQMNISPLQEATSYSITAITQDSYGDLWIGTADTGLYRYDRKQEKFINYINIPGKLNTLSSNSIRALQLDIGGDLWVATDKGLTLFDPLSNNSTRYQHSNNSPDSLVNDMIRTLYMDKGGNLWIGTNGGLDRFDKTSKHFIHYRHNPNQESSLSNDVVLSIYESGDNVLWFGTFGAGLNKYYRGQDRFSYFASQPGNPYSISGDIIFKIHADSDQMVWLAIYGNGVDCLNPLTGTAIHYRHDSANPASISSTEVWSVYTDREGTLWVGTAIGLDRRDQNAAEFIHYQSDPDNPRSITPGTVFDMLEDRDGNLWIGTATGLSHFNRETGTFTRFQHDPVLPSSLSGYEVDALYIDQSDNLWVGTTDDGLNRLDPKTGQFDHYRFNPNVAGSISNNYVLSIFQDSRGILWVGTFGGGLNRYDPETDTFHHYIETDGLPNNVIYGILEDDYGYLWLSTNNGISRFYPVTESFRNFSVNDGLQGNEFNVNAYSRDPQGNLYFGGVTGLTAFNPIAVLDSNYVPPIVITSITQNGIPVSPNTAPEAIQEITLPWPNNNFEFEYAALSYALPERNQYAYKLEDFDDSWNITGSLRDGRYTNLPGGTYTLRVKGSNQDGVWNDNGATIQVTVIPPFWQTTWFIITATAGTLGLLFSGYLLRVQRVQVYNRELERQVRDRTREIERLFEKTKELAVVEERNRLARELHDSAKQKAFAALAQLGTANGIISSNARAARNHLSEAENLVYEVIEDLTFLIQEMYPLALKEKGLATTLREYIFEWESRTDTRVTVRIEGYQRLRLEIEQAVYRIIQEALSNVARHSRATQVEVSLTCNDDMIEAVVRDNGCGFNQHTRPAGIGLRSIQERAESLGGTVKIESEPDCGTRLTALVPLIARITTSEGGNHV
jgi:ligand-binding sensor domain-containing protein/signal transduction histidine kinase